MKIGIFTTGSYPVNSNTVKATEFFVYGLASGLANLGHDITVFGAKGSNGNFKVINPAFEAPRESLSQYENDCLLAKNFADFVDYCNKNEVDIIHENSGELPVTLANFAKVPVVCTLHGVRPPSVLSNFYHSSNKNVFYISPSEFGKQASPDLKIKKIIPHGIDYLDFNFIQQPKSRFISLGRIIPGKGQMDAVRAAIKTGSELTIAGYTPKELSSEYFDEVIAKVDANPTIDFVGKIDREKVSDFMGASLALLMPVHCDEIFGLVMIEAMACGTPVIAYDRGSVKEIIEDGKTGFIVKEGDIDGLAKAMKAIGKIGRCVCRKSVEKNFSIGRMVKDYENVFQNLTGKANDIS